MATMAQAKRDFENGAIRKFRIDKTMGKITLSLIYVHGFTLGEEPLFDARTKEPRVFKTWNAAISAADMVGFDVTSIGN